MVKKCFVIQEEVIYLFCENFTFPQYKYCRFIYLILELLVFMEFGKTRNDFFRYNELKNKERICRKIQQNNQYRNKKSTLGWK